jgi:hypothetical protein
MYQCRNCTQDTKNQSKNSEGQRPSTDPAPETPSQYEKEQVANTSYYNLGSALKDSDLLQRMFRKANFTISDDAMSEEVGDKNYSAMADRNILEGYFGIDPKKYEGLEKTIVCVLTTKTGEKHLGFYTNQDEDRARKGAKTQALLSSSIKQHSAEPSKNHSLNSPTEQQIMTNHEKAKKQLMDAFDEAVSLVGEEYVARALCGLTEQSKKEYEAANLNAFVEELFELEQLFQEDRSEKKPATDISPVGRAYADLMEKTEWIPVSLTSKEPFFAQPRKVRAGRLRGECAHPAPSDSTSFSDFDTPKKRLAELFKENQTRIKPSPDQATGILKATENYTVFYGTIDPHTGAFILDEKNEPKEPSVTEEKPAAAPTESGYSNNYLEGVWMRKHLRDLNEELNAALKDMQMSPQQLFDKLEKFVSQNSDFLKKEAI